MKKNNLFCFVSFIVLEVIAIASLIFAAIINDEVVNIFRYEALVLLAIQVIFLVLALLKKNLKALLIVNLSVNIYFLSKYYTNGIFTNIYENMFTFLIFALLIVCIIFKDKKWASICALVVVSLYSFEAFKYFDVNMIASSTLDEFASTTVVNEILIQFLGSVSFLAIFLSSVVYFANDLFVKKEPEAVENKENKENKENTEE